MRKPEYIIDAHQHLWGQQLPEMFGEQTLELLLARNEELGVKESWLSCVPLDGRPFDGSADAYVEQAFRKYPDNIRGMGFIHLGTHRAEKVREFKDRGFFGLKIILPTTGYDDPGHDDIWAAAAELKMPITFHTGQRISLETILPWMNPLHMTPDRLERVAYCFPELIILIAHMGNIHFQCACCTALRKNVYLDASGCGDMKRMPKAYFDQTVYWENVKHKMLFGMDHLFTKHQDVIESGVRFVENVELSEENCDLFWHGNAEKIIQAVNA